MPWTFDAARKQYISPSGRRLDAKATAQLRNNFAAARSEIARTMAEQYASGAMTQAEFVTQFQVFISDTMTAGYMAGRGGVNALIDSDLESIFKLIDDQLGFASDFAKELPDLSADDIANRASLYGDAAVVSFEQGQAASHGAELPGYPGDWETACKAGCFIGETEVTSPELRRAFRRRYDGPVVIVRTSGGREFTSTPNHPILTTGGWVAAGKLDQGSDLICGSLVKDLSSRHPHVYDRPTPIREVFDSLLSGRECDRVVTTPMDFHGDGRDGEVDVVTINGELGSEDVPAIRKPRFQFDLKGSALVVPNLPNLSVTDRLRLRELLSPDCFMCGLRQLLTFFIGHGLHPDQIRFAHAASLNSSASQMAGDGLPIQPESKRDREFTLASLIASDDILNGNIRTAGRSSPERNVGLRKPVTDGLVRALHVLGDGIDCLSGEITTDQVVGVEWDTFHGDVFNLETQTGWYVASGIIAHNCRCYWEIVTNSDNETTYTWITVSDDKVCDDCARRGREWAPWSPA